VRSGLRDALRLYLVTDPVLCGPRGVIDVCRKALAAGVGFLQLRDKSACTRDLIEQAEALTALSNRHQALFVVNDRVDVAMASGAHGVHLGADDMPLATARRLMGPEALIGASVRTPEEALAAWNDGADYLAANIVFHTPTKPDPREPLGLSGVTLLAGATPLPLVAIGGINITNARNVIDAGAAGIAVVSAIMSAPDPALATRKLGDVIWGHNT
jgi:thiamine-phosphate pyrophosphorylase